MYLYICVCFFAMYVAEINIVMIPILFHANNYIRENSSQETIFFSCSTFVF